MFKGFFEKDSLWVKSIFILAVPLLLGISFLILNEATRSLFHVTDKVTTLKLTQFLSATGTFICASFALAYLFSQNVRQFLHLRNPRIILLIIITLNMWIAIPVINFLGELNSQITFPESLQFIEKWLRTSEENIAGLTELLLASDHTLTGLFINLLLMAVIPALGEELLFRGVIQNCFAKSLNSNAKAIWITAFLFSAIHLQFYGFVPRMLMGAYFGYLLVWSKSIWTPVMAHFANNATIVLFYFFLKDKNMDLNPDTIGADGSPLWIIGSVGLFSVLTVLIWKICRKM